MTPEPNLITQDADILVVDDEIPSLRLLTEILTKEGYQVRPVEKPQLALESALAHPPSLIMLDVRMPEMSGFEVCRQLKQDERTRDIPVFFMSALMNVEDRVKAFEAGGVDFVSKPFEELEILARVKTHVQLRNMVLHLDELVAARTAELTTADQALQKTEEAIIESEERYRGLSEAAFEAIFISESGVCLEQNSTAEKMFGYTSSEAIGRKGTEWIAPEDREMVMNNILSGYEEPYLATALRKDGSTFPAEIQGKMMHYKERDVRVTALNDITQRMQGEKALRESEEKFRTLVTNAEEIVYMIAKDGTFLLSEGKGLSKLGLKPGQVVGQSVFELYKDFPDMLDTLRKVFNGESITIELNVDDNYFRSWYTPHINQEGEIIGLMGLSVNITERVHVESALRESEEKYRTLVEQANDGIVVLQDGVIKFANSRLAELTGYTVEEVMNTAFPQYIAADELPIIADIYRRRMAGEAAPPTYDSVIQHKDGSRVEVEFNAGLTTIQGQVADLVIVRDISDRKRAEAQLKESHDFLVALMDSMGDAVFSVIFPERTIDWVNDSYGITGYDAQDCIGRTTEFLYSGEGEYLDFGNEIKNALNNGEDILHTEQTLRSKHGELFPVETTTTLFKESGKLNRATSIVRDVSERRRTEQQLTEYRERLNALASQLTIAEERERRRIAADLHDQVGQLLSFARLRLVSAQKAATDAKQVAMLDDVSVSLLQAIQDTKNLVFDLSSPLLYEIGLEAAIAEWLENQVGKTHSLKTEFIEEGQPINLEDNIKTMLFRSVRELLTNVIRHAEATQVTVRVKSSASSIIIIIEDNGVGFEVNKALSPTDRGDTFGLFSISERMKDLGGSLKITSEPGQGCQASLIAPVS